MHAEAHEAVGAHISDMYVRGPAFPGFREEAHESPLHLRTPCLRLPAASGEAQGELGRRMRHGARPAVFLQKGGESHERQVPGDFPGIVQDASVRRKAYFFPDRPAESGHKFRKPQAQGLIVSGIRHASLLRMK